MPADRPHRLGGRLRRAVGRRGRGETDETPADRPARTTGTELPTLGVTVVLLCEPADLPALPRGLASVLGQDHRPLTVLLCAVGPDQERGVLVERLTDAVTAHTEAAPLVLLGPEGPSWTAVATAGLEAAETDLVTVVRACDLLTPGALRRAAELQRAHGFAVSLAPVEQAGEPDPWFAAAQRRAHAHGRTPTHPPVVEHATLGGVVMQRSVLEGWGSGPAGIDPADETADGFAASITLARVLASVQPAADEPGALSGAAVLREPGYVLAPDHGTRAYGATPDLLPGLERRHERARAVVAALDDAPDLARAAARGWAASGLPALLVEAERATDDQWRRLVDLAREVPADHLDAVPAAARCLVHLAAADRRAAVVALAEDLERPDLRDTPPTETHDGALLAAWPAVVDLDDLPVDRRRLLPAETPARARGVRRVDGRADLFVAVRGLDLDAGAARVVVEGPHGEPLVARAADSDEATRWAADPGGRALLVSVDLPDGPTTDVAALALGVRVEQDDVVRAATVSLDAPPRPRRPAGAPEVQVADVALRADPGGDVLVLTGTGDLDAVRLAGPVEVTAPTAPGEQPLTTTAWGATVALPPAPFRVTAHGAPAPLGEALRDRLPLDLVGRTHRVRAHLGARGGLVLALAPPLADDEAGPYRQRLLQERYAVADRPVDPGLVYAETYGGRTATDSPRAIVEALLRQRPDLRVRWGVSDAAQAVPAGTASVLMRSREHHDVLATAGLLVLNTDVERWFARREGQVLLQCFHGYPSKAMGRSQWDALDLRPARVRALRHRGVDSWSAILTPTPEMTAHYREQYGYDGPAIEEGYPRDDDLTDPTSEDAVARRARTRDLLGVGDRTAVLYAPTWREQLATRPRGAAMSDHLDVAAAAESLGDGHVLLLRGHRFHDPAGSHRRDGAAPVVDVTTHPEINDLVLAADVAVLDYSSLRFDVALARRPMVFLVPDLEAYAAGTRRFLFPFTDSAPGPLVATTREVVEHVRDVEALRRATAADVAAFNERFHPFQDGRAADRVAARLLGLAGS